MDERYGFLYFIQGADGGPIKIGRATNPERRLYALQGSHWQDLRIIALVRTVCPATDERALHQLLADHRLRGEWFAPVDEVLLLASLAGRLERTGLTQKYMGDDETEARIEMFAEDARWLISLGRAAA